MVLKKLSIFSSGGTVYGDYKTTCYNEVDELKPISLYGMSKVIVENIIQYYSRVNEIEYLIIRPSNPFGKFQNGKGNQGLIAVIFDKILSNSVFEVWGDGSVIRDYISIDTLSKSVYMLSEKGLKNAVYNVCSGQGHSINDVISIIEKITKLKLNVVYKESRKN